MRSRGLSSVLVALLVVLAGCSTIVDLGGIEEPDSNRPDPDADVLGWEDGYWWNDSVAVDASDGLSTAELEVVVARMMARIEHLRGHEFTEDVAVSVISREEYRGTGPSDPEGTVREEQLWEATFIVGEDAGVGEAFDALYGSAVQGYYSGGQIVVVSDGDSGDLHISRDTLVHELEHALQDQQLSLRVNASTRDETLAGRGIVEGDANFVEHLYERRCANDSWDCVEVPAAGGGSDRGAYNDGLFVSTFVPYAGGSTFVADRYAAAGWDAVDAAFATQPASSEQLIHPAAYPEEDPVVVTVPDRSSTDWERAGRPQRVGEGTMYAMFWYNGQIPASHYQSGDDPVSRFTYDHPITAGWGGDALVPYQRDDGAQGYVWETTWDTEADAVEFHDAYVALLESHDADAVADGVYVVPDGPFADAFRVERDGKTVRIVNAPTVDALSGVHEGASPATNATRGGPFVVRPDAVA